MQDKFDLINIGSIFELFLFLVGPEGLGRKNFRKWTQCKLEIGPKGPLADIGSLKRFRISMDQSS
jgi:hypothetical protein